MNIRKILFQRRFEMRDIRHHLKYVLKHVIREAREHPEVKGRVPSEEKKGSNSEEMEKLEEHASVDKSVRMKPVRHFH